MTSNPESFNVPIDENTNLVCVPVNNGNITTSTYQCTLTSITDDDGLQVSGSPLKLIRRKQ